MPNPLALILIPAGFLFLWPLVARWLRRDDLLVALTAFGLSVGALSLLSFALAALGVLVIWPLLFVVALGWGLGYALNPDWFRLAWARNALYAAWASLTRLDITGLSLWVILISAVIILIHAVYYPFLADDTLSRYALQARLIYQSRALPADVRGFPLLVPLSFTYTWLANGALDEHLAKLVPAGFAFGMLGATVLLGRALSGRLNGALAGALLAVTPLFVDWGPTGYTDIPTGFCVALAALFAIRWCQDGARRDALLAGIMAGLALWTKQSALTLLASLVGVAALRAIARRQVMSGLSDLPWLLLPALLIAAPWYLRNFVLGGLDQILPLPGALHVHEVEPRLVGLLPSLQYTRAFGLPLAPLYALGILLAVWRAASGGVAALRRGDTWPVSEWVMLGVVLPYWLAWWTRFSFTARFLLLVMPIYAVWAAQPLTWLLDRLALTGRRLWLGVPLAGLLLLSGTRELLGGAYFALTQPLATDADKLLRAKRDLYPTVAWLEANLEPGDSVLTMDGRLHYYLAGKDNQFVTTYPLTFEQIAEFDYVLDASGTTHIYQTLGWTDSDYWHHRRDPYYFEEVFDGGQGSEVFRVLPTVADEAR